MSRHCENVEPSIAEDLMGKLGKEKRLSAKSVLIGTENPMRTGALQLDIETMKMASKPAAVKARVKQQNRGLSTGHSSNPLHCRSLTGKQVIVGRCT